jgi:hypothetical protein
MYPFIYFQIHMLEVRVKQLGKQVAEKEVAKAVRRQPRRRRSGSRWSRRRRLEGAAENEAEKEDDDEKEDQSWWPLGSSDDNAPFSPIRFPGVKRWFMCPICFNHLY